MNFIHGWEQAAQKTECREHVRKNVYGEYSKDVLLVRSVLLPEAHSCFFGGAFCKESVSFVNERIRRSQKKAATTYNAASDYYDHPANTFWGRYGRRTVERLGLATGERVLDVCCGSGASAIPAAEIVGADGSVVGVDLAENLLDLARAKAKQNGLTNVHFQSGDLMHYSQPFLIPHASDTRLFPVLSRLQKHQSLAKPRQWNAP